MNEPITQQPRPIGLLAEYGHPDRLVEAARELRASTSATIEAYSPFPIHELDEALKIPSTRLPWLVLLAGIGGGALALIAQWWMNAVDYAYIISGKPMFSLPANVPISFEIIILSAAGAAFLGVFLFTGLPKLYNPLLQRHSARRITSDRFLLELIHADNQADFHDLRSLLEQTDPIGIEVIHEEEAVQGIPKVIWAGILLLCTFALLPPLWIAKRQLSNSSEPPIMSFPDMDFQPKFKAQTTSDLFADQRAMRLPVAGTVARGELRHDDAFFRGLQPEGDLLSIDSVEDLSQLPWVDESPIEVSAANMARGRLQYNIYCATCHGRAGDGDGPVSKRALALEQGTWVPPTSIHMEYVVNQPDGQLYNTITNGVRKMPGYGDQISVEDRWAIVLYLRALQRTRTAAPKDFASDELIQLRDLN